MLGVDERLELDGRNDYGEEVGLDEEVVQEAPTYERSFVDGQGMHELQTRSIDEEYSQPPVVPDQEDGLSELVVDDRPSHHDEAQAELDDGPPPLTSPSLELEGPYGTGGTSVVLGGVYESPPQERHTSLGSSGANRHLQRGIGGYEAGLDAQLEGPLGATKEELPIYGGEYDEPLQYGAEDGRQPKLNMGRSNRSFSSDLDIERLSTSTSGRVSLGADTIGNSLPSGVVVDALSPEDDWRAGPVNALKFLRLIEARFGSITRAFDALCHKAANVQRKGMASVTNGAALDEADLYEACVHLKILAKGELQIASDLFGEIDVHAEGAGSFDKALTVVDFLHAISNKSLADDVSLWELYPASVRMFWPELVHHKRPYLEIPPEFDIPGQEFQVVHPAANALYRQPNARTPRYGAPRYARTSPHPWMH